MPQAILMTSDDFRDFFSSDDSYSWAERMYDAGYLSDAEYETANSEIDTFGHVRSRSEAKAHAWRDVA
jgi:hypothetical protein